MAVKQTRDLSYAAVRRHRSVQPQGLVWVGRRRPKWARGDQDYVDDHIWQLPQGGIDKGERARDAAFRELWEETGVSERHAAGGGARLAQLRAAARLLGVALKGKYRGQRLRWFAMRFTGEEDEIDIAPKGRHKAEFDDWRWRRRRSCRTWPCPSSGRSMRRRGAHSRLVRRR